MVRNITALLKTRIGTYSDRIGWAGGALAATQGDSYAWTVEGNTTYDSISLEFNANNAGYYNQMSGHANGDDIHPYSIKLLPILIY